MCARPSVFKVVAMHALRITLMRSEADEIRQILREHMRYGASFTERRSWFFWSAFTITGPHHAMRRVRSELDQWELEQYIQDAW